jgi:hypothetical protein
MRCSAPDLRVAPGGLGLAIPRIRSQLGIVRVASNSTLRTCLLRPVIGPTGRGRFVARRGCRLRTTLERLKHIRRRACPGAHVDVHHTELRLRRECTATSEQSTTAPFESISRGERGNLIRCVETRGESSDPRRSEKMCLGLEQRPLRCVIGANKITRHHTPLVGFDPERVDRNNATQCFVECAP